MNGIWSFISMGWCVILLMICLGALVLALSFILSCVSESDWFTGFAAILAAIGGSSLGVGLGAGFEWLYARGGRDLPGAAVSLIAFGVLFIVIGAFPFLKQVVQNEGLWTVYLAGASSVLGAGLGFIVTRLIPRSETPVP